MPTGDKASFLAVFNRFNGLRTHSLAFITNDPGIKPGAWRYRGRCEGFLKLDSKDSEPTKQ
jgi:hypothetical protein